MREDHITLPLQTASIENNCEATALTYTFSQKKEVIGSVTHQLKRISS